MSAFKAANGVECAVRPVRPDDETLMKQFEASLGEETVKAYMSEAVPLEERVAHKRMIPLCHPDFLRQVPLVAIAEGKIVGTMRMAKVPLTKNARILVEVADAFQKQGLGKYLVEQGLKIAQAEQVEKVSMKFFEDNAAMTKLATAFGFEMAAKDGVVTATKAF